jgi:hypothetical protein
VVAAGRDLALVVEQPVEQSRLLRHAGSKPVPAILLTVVPRAIPFTQDERRPHYSNDRTGWLPAGVAGLCQKQTSLLAFVALTAGSPDAGTLGHK